LFGVYHLLKKDLPGVIMPQHTINKDELLQQTTNKYNEVVAIENICPYSGRSLVVIS